MQGESLNSGQEARTFGVYLDRFRSLLAEREVHSQTADGMVAIIQYLWDHRHNRAERTKASVAEFIRQRFPDLRQPEQFVKRQTREIERLLPEVTTLIGHQIAADMRLARSQGHEPLALQFSRRASGEMLPERKSQLDDFDLFWQPYRNNTVETKVIFGQPGFIVRDGSQYRKIDTFADTDRSTDANELVYPYVRSWDMRSGLKIQETLVGMSGASSESVDLVRAARVTLESARKYTPVEDEERVDLRGYNVVAFGYPRDNAVLADYQSRRGLTIQVLPDDDFASAEDATPRVMKAGASLLDQLTGDPQLKRCVLTRRHHSDGHNVVTLIAGNSSRAIAEVIVRLCNRGPAGRLIGDARRRLQEHANDETFPTEFQCIFDVEFTRHGLEVRLDDCIAIQPHKWHGTSGNPPASLTG